MWKCKCGKEPTFTGSTDHLTEWWNNWYTGAVA